MQTCWEVQGAQRCLYTEIQYTRTHAHLFTDTLGMHTSNTGMHIHTGDPQVGTHRVPTYMPICYVRYTYTSICYFLSLFLLGMDLGIHENKYTYKFQSTHTYHTYMSMHEYSGCTYVYIQYKYTQECLCKHTYIWVQDRKAENRYGDLYLCEKYLYKQGCLKAELEWVAEIRCT